jgi:DNA polymerase (family X)
VPARRSRSRHCSGGPARRERYRPVLELLTLPGLRPDKVLKLDRELGIAGLAELEAAAQQDRIKATKGFGAALQRKILQGLEIRQSAQGARHMHHWIPASVQKD